MAQRRDETADGITQRDRVKTDVMVSEQGTLVDPSGNPVGVVQGAGISADAGQALTLGTDDKPFLDESLLGGAAFVAPATGGRGVIAFVFDDGYQSNVAAIPIFRKFGFAATVAVEADKVGQNYLGDPTLPVVTPANMRDMIAAGWDIGNHPALDLGATEAAMITAAAAENDLLRRYLTGEALVGGGSGSVTNPEFSAWAPTTAVYRFGNRNATSDTAYRYLYQQIRSTPGSTALSGDWQLAFSQGGERTMQMAGYPADESVLSVAKMISLVQGVAQSGSSLVFYAHHTPSATPASTTPPYITLASLERVLKACSDLGVQVVPLSRLLIGNSVLDTRFDNSFGSFQNRAGDSAGFVTSGTLHGQARVVQLVSADGAVTEGTAYITENFITAPFSRYRITIRYKIDTALTLTGGINNRNHGLYLSLNTLYGDAGSNLAGVHRNADQALNDPAATARCPYLATSGWASYTTELCTLNGTMASLRVSLHGCTGTALIGQITVEKGQSLAERPLSGAWTFNGVGERTVILPKPEATGSRATGWTLTTSQRAILSAATYTYAYEDSASIASPVAGNTCYVLGAGANAFAGQGGKLATYNGSAWVFTTINPGACFRVTTFQGLSDMHVHHLGVATEGGVSRPVNEVQFSRAFDDYTIVDQVNLASMAIYTRRGRRVDAFTWTAYPRGA